MTLKQRLIISVVALVLLAASFTGGYYYGVRKAYEVFPEPLEIWEKDLGLRVDTGTAPNVIRFLDGSWRMYYTVEEGIVSASSQNGIDWGKEQGFRMTGDPKSKDHAYVGSPTVFAIAADKYRMIYEASSPDQKQRRLFSAVSPDGITWTRESGVRLEDTNMYKQTVASVPDVVKLSDGRLRLYYSDGQEIKAAVSKDLGLTWQKEGVTGLLAGAMDPSVFVLSGTFKIYYTVSASLEEPKNLKIVSAHSEDGLHWLRDRGARVEADKGTVMVMDPNVVFVSLGKLRMYYSQVEKGSLTDPKDPPVIGIHSASLELR